MLGSISGLSYRSTAPVYMQRQQSSTPAIAERAALPVQSVPAVREVISNHDKFSTESLLQQYENDPVNMAARMRIQNSEQDPRTQGSQEAESVQETESAQEVMEETECQTCAERTYKDGSNDPGVSFKTATHLSPGEAASAVRGHEMEHVTRNRAKAEREDREIVSQSVMIHTAICPECGRVYTSGGTTRTVTRGANNNAAQQQNTKNRSPFSAVA